MLVRLAIERDREALRILGRMQVEETQPHLVWSDERANATWGRYLVGGNPVFFVVEDCRELVGYLYALSVDYGFTCGFFVTQEVIYIRPDKRGTRAAAMLVRAFNEWADRLQPNEVFAGVANGFKQERTTRFFEHFGFTRVGQYLRRIPGVRDG